MYTGPYLEKELCKHVWCRLAAGRRKENQAAVGFSKRQGWTGHSTLALSAVMRASSWTSMGHLRGDHMELGFKCDS